MPFGFENMDNKPKQYFNGYAKQYVAVVCLHTVDGRILPQVIIYDDLHKYEVEKVLDVRSTSSLKVGGSGLRYTVRILNQQTYLFFDDYERRWFVEAKEQHSSTMENGQ